jgi:hypothetical protein
MGKESLEGIKPFGANDNTSTAIVFPFWVIRVIAALLHLVPGAIFGRRTHTVPAVAHYADLATQTATAPRIAAPYI